jgi:hypothetical protein
VKRVHVAGRAPLALGGFFAVPLFFASLMAFSLAMEKPHRAGGTLQGTTSSLEGKIWAVSLIPALIVVAVGAVAMLSRYGVFASCLAAIVVAFVVTSRLGDWAHRHARRFPLGEDLIPGNDPSNHLDRGQWESQAKETALSIAHWTVALAVAAALITLALELRRRRKPVHPVPPLPPPVIEGGAQTSVTTL